MKHNGKSAERGAPGARPAPVPVHQCERNEAFNRAVRAGDAKTASALVRAEPPEDATEADRRAPAQAPEAVSTCGTAGCGRGGFPAAPVVRLGDSFEPRKLRQLLYRGPREPARDDPGGPGPGGLVDRGGGSG